MGLVEDNLNYSDKLEKVFTDIHKHVFKDIYSWAGEFRTVNISKGTSFCNYLFITEMSNEMLSTNL